VTERAKPLRVAIDAEGGPMVVSHSPVAGFLMRALETPDGINELLALFDGPEENVARRVSGWTANDGHSFCESLGRNKRPNIELPISIATNLRSFV
jgi:hypothetical protein